MSKVIVKQKYKRRGVAFALLCVTVAICAQQVMAAPNWMSPAEMTATFGGHSIAGTYANGGMKFTETYKTDGSINYTDERGPMTGRWHISTQGFCTFYDSTPGGCFLVRKSGENCFEFYVVEGQDSGPVDNPRDPPLVAQGWYVDRPNTCTALSV